MRANVREILADNGLGSDPPEWFVDLWRALLAAEPTGRIEFPPAAMDGEEVDVTNALADLAAVLPLGYEDYGEGIVLEPPTLGAWAFISREGRDGSYSFEVQKR